ncbi:MAG: hypothetical protein OEU76_03970, partial [Cyclobacteriaceae bacterium]|nr:hypothetical protein [Cyclobacteriaceae bacterium]
FALSLLFAAAALSGGSSSGALRVMLLMGGILSLAGLLGIPWDNMQIRNIGILGYAVIAPIAFLMMGRMLSRKMDLSDKQQTSVNK